MGFEIWNKKNLKFRQISANIFKALNKSGLLTYGRPRATATAEPPRPVGTQEKSDKGVEDYLFRGVGRGKYIGTTDE